MTVYLHIGTPKTGSTSIQCFLHTNRDVLKKLGYLYPCSILNPYRFDHNIFAWELKTHLENKAWIPPSFHELQKELTLSQANNVIISSESLQIHCNAPQDIEYLKNLLVRIGFTQIYIIIYLRHPQDLFVSMCSQVIKNAQNEIFLSPPKNESDIFQHIYDYRETIQNYEKVFGRENLRIRLFDKEEWYEKDLLKDFLATIDVECSTDFVFPPKWNETLDLLGIEILKRVNVFNMLVENKENRNMIVSYFEKHYSSRDSSVKFMPPKELYQAYGDYFMESNEWVRQNFFPHKDVLFPPKNLEHYQENYELKEMKPEYFDTIGACIADILNDLAIYKAYHNDVSYRLGNAVLHNAHGFLGYIKTLFAVLYIKKQEEYYKHKKDLQIIEYDMNSLKISKDSFIHHAGYTLNNVEKKYGGGGGKSPSSVCESFGELQEKYMD